MIEDINFTHEFLQIASIMTQKSNGRLRLISYHLDEKLRHFVEFNGRKIREDIEYYGEGSVKNKESYFLPEFMFFINEIKTDCPDSYHEGMIMLLKIGNKVFKPSVLENWKRIFEFYLGP